MKHLYELKQQRRTKAEDHELRVQIIRRAIEAALKGNASLYDEAAVWQIGTTKQAKAYKAAFAQVPRPRKFEVDGHAYSGKLTPEIAAAISACADELARDWSGAYLKVFPLSQG